MPPSSSDDQADGESTAMGARGLRSGHSVLGRGRGRGHTPARSDSPRAPLERWPSQGTSRGGPLRNSLGGYAPSLFLNLRPSLAPLRTPTSAPLRAPTAAEPDPDRWTVDCASTARATASTSPCASSTTRPTRGATARSRSGVVRRKPRRGQVAAHDELARDAPLSAPDARIRRRAYSLQPKRDQPRSGVWKIRDNL